MSALSSAILGEKHYSASFHQRNPLEVRFQDINRFFPFSCNADNYTVAEGGWPSILIDQRPPLECSKPFEALNKEVSEKVQPLGPEGSPQRKLSGMRIRGNTSRVVAAAFCAENL